MDSYVKNQLKRKVSSFILSEAGKVGNRNTFSAAALVTASSLAAIILTSQSALAGNCGPRNCDTTYCCADLEGHYDCSDIIDEAPDVTCWHIN